jgi:hypothetical protein
MPFMVGNKPTEWSHEMRVFILAIFLLISLPALAEEPSWESDKASLEALSSQNLSDDERCGATWGILWPWAKKGNLEARERLYFYTLMMPHNDVIQMPGSHGDFASRLYDGLILAVHSSGAQYKKDIYVDLVKGFLSDLGLERTKFYRCFKDEQTEDCARVAVEEGLVPSFEDFSTDIEMFLAQGKKQTCFYVRSEEATKHINPEKGLTNGK